MHSVHPKHLPQHPCFGLRVCPRFFIARNHDAFDRPLTALINQFVGKHPSFDRFVFAVFLFPTYSGAFLMALVWSCWFQSPGWEHRSRVLMGTLAAFPAGLTSRFFQGTLPTHSRPYYDAALNMRLGSGFDVPLGTWNSFPSDHATVFFGLAIVAYVASSRFAFAAIVLTAIAEMARVYIGGHYPSDLIGSAGLAGIVVWITQTPIMVSAGGPFIEWSQRRPSLS